LCKRKIHVAGFAAQGRPDDRTVNGRIAVSILNLRPGVLRPSPACGFGEGLGLGWCAQRRAPGSRVGRWWMPWCQRQPGTALGAGWAWVCGVAMMPGCGCGVVVAALAAPARPRAAPAMMPAEARGRAR